MKTIHKHVFVLGDEAEVSIIMPKGARVLAFHEQDARACLWVLVDTKATPDVRRFRVVQTNMPINDLDALEYVGTASVRGVPLHAFEVTQ